MLEIVRENKGFSLVPDSTGLHMKVEDFTKEQHLNLTLVKFPLRMYFALKYTITIEGGMRNLFVVNSTPMLVGNFENHLLKGEGFMVNMYLLIKDEGDISFRFRLPEAEKLLNLLATYFTY